jgi:hypothetical protein
MQKIRIMTVWYVFVFIIFSAIFYCGNIYAEEIILDNGHVLTENIIQAEKGTLSFATIYSEPMTNQTSKIQKMSSATPVEIHLTGREVPKPIPHTAADGQLKVELNENWTVTLANTIDYERKPSAGLKISDILWTLGVQYNY